jgi:hypothetical protein
MEPDDMLAILLFALSGKFVLHGVVVGEAKAAAKVTSMCRYLRLLRADKTTEHFVTDKVIVVQGTDSKADFPDVGKEFNDDKQSTEKQTTEGDTAEGKWPTVLDSSPSTYKTVLSAFLSNAQPASLVILKPPRELIRVWRDITKGLAEATLYMYGSFNIRCLLDRQRAKESRAEIIALLTAFKLTMVYESFQATGSLNSMTPTNMPTFFKAFQAHKHPVAAAIRKLIGLWNAFNLADCRDTCKALLAKHGGSEEAVLASTDGPQYKRNKKAADDIEPNKATQMVLADSGLAACMCRGDPPKGPFTMTIGEGAYTVYSKSTDKGGGLYTWQGLPWTSVEGWLVDSLQGK